MRAQKYLLLLLRLVQGAIACLLEEDLLHLAVLQVVQLPHRVLRPLDEVYQYPGRPLPANEIVLKENRGQWWSE